MSIGMPADGYTLLTATTYEETKIDSDEFQTPQAQIVDVELRHDNYGTASVMRPSRPKYVMQDVLLPGSVTRFEQDMIFLISNFSGRHSTEAGRIFVEQLSRVTDAADFMKEVSNILNPSDIIMWPTHEPDVKESVDGDFCSDVNWIFAYCHKKGPETSDSQMSATIIGSLHPLSPSQNYSELYSTVFFEKPDKYMRAKGAILHAATQAYSEYMRSPEGKKKICKDIFASLLFISVFVIFYIFVFFLIRFFFFTFVKT
jgi:hypothetical protein